LKKGFSQRSQVQGPKIYGEFGALKWQAGHPPTTFPPAGSIILSNPGSVTSR
jgi:hypothetical protein